MKKLTLSLVYLIIISLSLLIVILSTTGIETSKFNNLISKKINNSNSNISLELDTIKFKFDIKKISLFLETSKPVIKYRKAAIPATNIKVYINFISIIKSNPEIKKIYLKINQIDIKKIQEISFVFKPSNFTSLLQNRIKQGKLDVKIEFYLDKNNLLDDFIARGSVSNLKIKISDKINLNKTRFNFFADKSDVLIKKVFSQSGPIKIEDGDVKLSLSKNILLESNFKTNLNYTDKSKDYLFFFKDLKYIKNIKSLDAILNNTFIINFDETYKVKKYNYKSSGKVFKATLNFEKFLENYIQNEEVNEILLINSDINVNLNSKQKAINILGNYSLGGKNDFLSFNLKNLNDNKTSHLNLNVDYKKKLKLEIINYEKPENSVANIIIDLYNKENSTKINKFSFTEGKSLIFAEDINFYKGKFSSFKKIIFKTTNDGKKNNDFFVSFGKKILIKGSKFDATNLPKILNKKKTADQLVNINKDIEIDFTNIIAPLSEKLTNFKLIGKIEKGKFIKINSKGDFSENNFLDITLKKNKKDKKKYLEIYSDLTKPLLTEYSFFKGLLGGKLLYTSIIDGENSFSKLKIENFKVINAPGMVQLLSLADLGGLADLAKGEGISFDILEITMNKSKDQIQISEMLALGPSISVLMEGYQNQKITSLRGTLVPAKTLNNIISKIPVIGDIIIPKEVGEGLFGISFKMKGPPGEIKTSINPIRTITPRFIQKIIDRNKETK